MSKQQRGILKPIPTYQEEAALISQGYWPVAGLDEAGRGPLAGPVVAGIAILPPKPTEPWPIQIRDSKQMTAIQREKTLVYLQDRALALATGISSAREIDKFGIVTATQLAMQRALNSLTILHEFLLLDAFPLPGVKIPQKPIIHGDSICLSIAAASVVAKVTRDKIMEEQDALYPNYGFAKHKGYPTREHVNNIRDRGPCPIHRYSFAPVSKWKAKT